MRLKLIVHVNFQQTEAENFKAALKEHKIAGLAAGEVVLMVSLSETQLVFMYRPSEMDMSQYGGRKGTATVFHSERLRLSRSTFSTLMIQNYAREAGLNIDGLRTLEEYIGHKPDVVDVKKSAKKKSTGKAKGATVTHISAARKAA